MLYEDIAEQTKSTAMLLQLSKNSSNIRQLLENGSLFIIFLFNILLNNNLI